MFINSTSLIIAKKKTCQYFFGKDKPVTAFLFTFVFTWNEFMFALLMTRRAVRPMTVVISSLAGGHTILWAQIAAAGVITIIPGVLVVIFLQRYIVRGLTMGALKN